MSDCSPLRASGDHTSPSQSTASHESPNNNNIDKHDDEGLKYGAKHVIKLFIPISLCMVVVVGTMKLTDTYNYTSDNVIWYAPFTDQTVDTGTRLWQSLANALIMLCVIVVMTTLLIMLYKFKFYRVIHGWLILSSLLLLFIFTLMYVAEILRAYNIPLDDYTLMIGIWNFGVVGMACIHWKGPLILQQCYLIMISALMALVFIKYLPDWTTWTVLAVVSIWDLVAVLSPKGPLRILVETAQERNEPIFPALIYSSAVAWIAGAATVSLATTVVGQTEHGRSPGTSSDTEEPPRVDFIQHSDSVIVMSSTPNQNRRSRSENNVRLTNDTVDVVTNVHDNKIPDDDDRGIKLGLGDFIFFSVLVGKASSYGDWNITFACYVAILVGLCMTLALLAIARKALPALPISIAFGLTSFFLALNFAVPFSELLAWEQVYI
ncbi:Presenilin sel-12, partial [Fragariocoptes setiger]